MKPLLHLFLFAILSIQSSAQGIKGNVTTPDNAAIPYSTIFVKEISMGTTTNSDGFYEIQLLPGTYTVQFQSLGFVPVTQLFEVGTSTIERKIVLAEQVFQLHEIRVYARNEDPAYPIMRRAISMAPFYLNQVQKYSADVYLKGTAKLEKVPKLLQKGFNVEIDGAMLKVGDLYVGENFSEIEFEAPNLYKQKIISSNMSMMEDKGQTFNMGLITSSAYEPEMDYVILPFSSHAFSHYNFKYEGCFTEGKLLINKIKVIPKQKSRQLVTGTLYIVDGLWCLHSLDISSDQYFGSINTQIQFAELRERVWLPISHNITIVGKMMGIKGKANYTSSLKYKSIKLNDKLEVPLIIEKYIEEQNIEAQTVEKAKTKRQQQIEEIMQKEELSNRDAIRIARLAEKESKELKKVNNGKEPIEIPETYKVEREDSATMRGDDYWASMRPNPLSTEELVSFGLSDSLQELIAIKKDSLSKTPHKNKIVTKMLFGSTWKFRNDSLRIKYNGLVSIYLLNFNAVGGRKYQQKISFNLKMKNHNELNSAFVLGYSFHRKQFQSNINGNWLYSPRYLGNLYWNAGNTISDYLGEEGISPIINSVYSLLFKENIARYQQQKYLSVTNNIEITNGLKLKTGFGYFDRSPLDNITNMSIFLSDKAYQPNEITDGEGNKILISREKSSIITLGLNYIPGQHYRLHDGKKQPEWSQWPEFSITYQKAIAVFFGAKANWESLQLGIQQEMKMGVYSNFTYNLRGGIFLNSKHIGYADYFGFKTNPVHVEIKDKSDYFQLLPIYQYHTNDRFMEFHTTYTTPYLLIKFLPWFNERMWRENLQLNYLTQPGFKNYAELGYSISEIFIKGEAGVFTGFENGKFTSAGIRVTMKF